MKIKRYLFIMILWGVAGWGSFSSHNEPEGSQAWIDKQAKLINAQAGNIDPNVLKLGLKAYSKARQSGYDQRGLLTIIDYSKVSTERRLWVVDMNSDRVLFNTWVTHGKNSGGLKATDFSNEPRTLKSSYGVFVTDQRPYFGGVGYALRLKGLEHGINDNAYRRDIVVHGAWYASPDVIKSHGILGRSWGCPAVDAKLAKPLIDTIKNSTLVFVYAPEYKWLKTSPFLA